MASPDSENALTLVRSVVSVTRNYQAFYLSRKGQQGSNPLTGSVFTRAKTECNHFETMNTKHSQCSCHCSGCAAHPSELNRREFLFRAGAAAATAGIGLGTLSAEGEEQEAL
jgi:hypothetical protein